MKHYFLAAGIEMLTSYRHSSNGLVSGNTTHAFVPHQSVKSH